MYSLSTLLSDFKTQCFAIDEQLKNFLSEYSSLSTELNEIIKKSSGSVLTRSLSDVISSQNIIETENLTTIFVAVTINETCNFISQYEFLSEDVVPSSAKFIASDKMYRLYSIIVLKKSLDQILAKISAKGWIIRHEISSEKEEISIEDEKQRLEFELSDCISSLIPWIHAAFDDVTTIFLHLNIMKCKVEANLLFGPSSSDFTSFLIVPTGKVVKKTLLDSILVLMNSKNNSKIRNQKVLLEEEDLPFVCISLLPFS
ncbi:hypothetical protein RCL1_000219 [Eukaryota sp. TZLM3-RCL]